MLVIVRQFFIIGGIWNILKKGVGLGHSSTLLVDELKQQNLASHSLLLLLVLINNCPTLNVVDQQGGDSVCMNMNPYRQAIANCGNDTS